MTVEQLIGRLHRLGQFFKQIIDIITVSGDFDNLQLNALCRKYIHTLVPDLPKHAIVMPTDKSMPTLRSLSSVPSKL